MDAPRVSLTKCPHEEWAEITTYGDYPNCVFLCVCCGATRTEPHCCV